MPTIRYEFLSLGKGGESSPVNVIRGNPPDAGTLEVGTSATTPASRPRIPEDRDWGNAVRLIADEAPIYVTWGMNPTATLTNSLMLLPGIAEVIYVQDSMLLSFISPAV